MTGQPDGLLRRAYTALTACYAVICCLPVTLAQLANASAPPDSMPGYTDVQGRVESCVGKFGCPTETDLSEVLLTTVLVLVPSLLVAVPLCAYLARTWQRPILGAVTAALIGWAVLCGGGILYLNA